jgi:hypothetical protein
MEADMRQISKILFLSLAPLTVTHPAIADVSDEFNAEVPSEGSSMMYAGALGGATLKAYDGEFRPIFGLQGGFQFRPHWGYGAYGTLETSGRWTLAGEGSYFFSGALMGLRVGAKAGIHLGGPGTEFAWGPHVVYDWAVGAGWSVGAEANWLQDAHLLVTGKYWF